MSSMDQALMQMGFPTASAAPMQPVQPAPSNAVESAAAISQVLATCLALWICPLQHYCFDVQFHSSFSLAQYFNMLLAEDASFVWLCCGRSLCMGLLMDNLSQLSLLSQVESLPFPGAVSAAGDCGSSGGGGDAGGDRVSGEQPGGARVGEAVQLHSL